MLGKDGAGVEYLVGTMIEVPRGRADRGRDREGGRVLLLRDQRPHPDGLRALARRRRASSCSTTRSTASWRRTRSSPSTRAGVGQLVEIGVQKGREVKPDLKIGVCGEHGGDPASIRFFHEAGPRLRLLLALPRAHRAPGRGPGPAREARGGLRRRRADLLPLRRAGGSSSSRVRAASCSASARGRCTGSTSRTPRSRRPPSSRTPSTSIPWPSRTASPRSTTPRWTTTRSTSSSSSTASASTPPPTSSSPASWTSSWARTT